MRKMTSLLLAAGMTMALLSGCGGGTEAKETMPLERTFWFLRRGYPDAPPSLTTRWRRV